MGGKRRNNPDERIFYHGSPSGRLVGGVTGIHVGTRKAAESALEARIGVPAEGHWDGTRVYGETLLMGQRNLSKLTAKGIYKNTGYNCDAPEDDYYPSKRTHYSDGTVVAFDSKPTIFQVRIKGKMYYGVCKDFPTNIRMAKKLKAGTASYGYYYKEEGEDAGSIAACVPSRDWLEPLDGLPHNPRRNPPNERYTQVIRDYVSQVWPLVIRYGGKDKIPELELTALMLRVLDKHFGKDLQGMVDQFAFANYMASDDGMAHYQREGKLFIWKKRQSKRLPAVNAMARLFVSMVIGSRLTDVQVSGMVADLITQFFGDDYEGKEDFIRWIKTDEGSEAVRKAIKEYESGRQNPAPAAPMGQFFVRYVTLAQLKTDAREAHDRLGAAVKSVRTDLMFSCYYGAVVLFRGAKMGAVWVTRYNKQYYRQ